MEDDKNIEAYVNSLKFNPEKNVKIDDVVVSGRTKAKIEMDLMKKLYKQIVLPQYKCRFCQCLPRPNGVRFRVCSNHSRLICVECVDKCCGQKHPPLPIGFKMDEFWPFQCQNTKYGCQELLMKDDLLEHEPYCDYQKVYCAVTECESDVSLLNYLDHFNQNHSKCVSYEEKSLKLHFPLKANNENWLPKKIIAFNETFFEVGIVRNNFVFRWIYILALPEQAKNYFFHATVQMPTTGEPLKYYGQVRSLVESAEEVIANEAFAFSLTTAKRFAQEENQELKYSIKIRCLKDEAKDEDVESGIDD